MSKARLNKGWRIHDLNVVILENSFLRAIILPGAGARSFRLIYKPIDSNLLWNHPRITPTKIPFGVRYDDAWCGGWDELFPNNEPAEINGELFPVHGETWAVEWDWQAAEPTAAPTRQATDLCTWLTKSALGQRAPPSGNSC